LVLGVCAVLALHQVTKVAHNETLKSFAAYSNALSGAVAAQFFERYGDVQAFASNEIFHVGKPADIQKALNHYVRLYQIYDGIIYVNSEGQVVTLSNEAPDGSVLNVSEIKTRSFSEAPWFRAARDGKFTEDKERGFAGTFFEDAQIDRVMSEVYGRPMYGNSFTTVVKDKSGKFLGVLTARAGFRWVEGEFVQLYEKLAKMGLKSAELTLLDKNGVVLIDHDPSLRDGKNIIQHDWNILLKFNLAEQGVRAAQYLVEKKSGTLVGRHARKKIDQFTGFQTIDDAKFVPSIGWNVMIRVSEAERMALFRQIQIIFMVGFVVLLVGSMVLAVWFSSRLTSSIRGISTQLNSSSQSLSGLSGRVASMSEQLNASSSHQASAVHETVSSVDQIEAMVKRTMESAEQSRSLSEESRQGAHRGQQTVETLRASIQSLASEMQAIREQVQTNNQELNQVIGIIENISSQTKVINDIVLQTKLLSFNASIESARAGEAGKSFGVVAAEIGQLASMSGEAAKQISALLQSSTDRVHSIVSNSTAAIDTLTQRAQSAVNQSQNHAEECASVLGEIQNAVERVAQMLTEISTASTEQSHGVREISKAMGQVDRAAQETMKVVGQATDTAQSLDGEASTLGENVQQLLQFIDGEVSADGRPSSTIVDANSEKDDQDWPTKPVPVSDRTSPSSLRRVA